MTDELTGRRDVMTHNVEFYIPPKQTIPTGLCLMADGKQVNYFHLPDKFGYDFSFFHDETKDEALEITKYLTDIMCAQSYDHGQEWRVTSIEIVEQEERYKTGEIVRVLFRIRDSY